MNNLWDFCIINDEKKSIHVANVEPMPLEDLTVLRSKFLPHGRRFMNVPAGEIGGELIHYKIIFCEGRFKVRSDCEYYNSNRIKK